MALRQRVTWHNVAAVKDPNRKKKLLLEGGQTFMFYDVKLKNAAWHVNEINPCVFVLLIIGAIHTSELDRS